MAQAQVISLKNKMNLEEPARIKRVKSLKNIILNKLNNDYVHITTQQTFILGLIIGQSENLVAFLESGSFELMDKSDLEHFNYVQGKFRSIMGFPLTLDALDKNTALIS